MEAWKPMHFIANSGQATPVFEVATIRQMEIACLATRAIDRAITTSRQAVANKQGEGRQ